MYNTIGERLSYCRNLLGISRREFVESIGGLSLPTLSRWELNYSEISEKKLEELLKFYNSNGISVTKNWILFGSDLPPLNKNLHSFEELNFDEIAFLSLNTVKNNIKNFEIIQINTNFYEPNIYHGDYIGGCPESAQHDYLSNKLCYINKNNLVYVGIFDYNKSFISNFYRKNLAVDIATDKIGQVLWIAKRF